MHLVLPPLLWTLASLPTTITVELDQSIRHCLLWREVTLRHSIDWSWFQWGPWKSSTKLQSSRSWPFTPASYFITTDMRATRNQFRHFCSEAAAFCVSRAFSDSQAATLASLENPVGSGASKDSSLILCPLLEIFVLWTLTASDRAVDSVPQLQDLPLSLQALYLFCFVLHSALVSSQASLPPLLARHASTRP